MIAQPLSHAEAADLAQRISSLTAAGLPLADGLRAAADDSASRRVAGVLRMVAAEIERGAPLELALGTLDQSLPAYVQGAIRAGVRSGALAEVLARLVQADRTQRQIRREVRLALAYPVLLLAMMVALMTFVAFIVLPQFRVIFDDFDAELPAVTSVMLGLSDGVFQLWQLLAVRLLTWSMIAFILLLVLLRIAAWAGWSLASTAAARPALRVLAMAGRVGGAIADWPLRILSTAPYIGPMFLWQAAAQWSRLLALLVDARVPLPDALELAAQGTPSVGLARLTAPLADGVRAGHSLGTLIEHSSWLPASLGPLIDWGQKTGELPAALRTSADMFEGRVRLRASLLKQVGPPVMFLVVASFLCLVIAALFLPLISFIQMLS
jgi:type II secretory pathway component PulF